ncbi:BadF/BadG/BcrA/BcrD ATPase family protein [Sulfitobacter sp. PS-8MA]|uniref:BadF/BadG/BcrA/BcrD ATPase family protein n=1 Tax=Sulfitobacter sp. PS-8MA TaxID=3237707 RepID=UPI0034C5B319
MTISAQDILIAVDGGGTGCRAAVGTAAGILGRAEGGRANIGTDPAQTLINLRMAVEAAAAAAGLPLDALAGATAYIGLAGMNPARDAARLQDALPYRRIIADDDRPACVRGALGAGVAGWVLAIGTGTIIAATDGVTCRYVGGWGFHLADQGSGAWLGRAALDRALQCHDGLLPHSDLTRGLLRHFGEDPFAVTAFSLTAQPGDYAAFAPEVLRAARRSDPLATALMQEGAAYCCRGLRALGFTPGDRLCLLGGIGPHYAGFLPSDHLSGLVAPQGTALDGALELARRAVAEEALT